MPSFFLLWIFQSSTSISSEPVTFQCFTSHNFFHWDLKNIWQNIILPIALQGRARKQKGGEGGEGKKGRERKGRGKEGGGGVVIQAVIEFGSNLSNAGTIAMLHHS